MSGDARKRTMKASRRATEDDAVSKKMRFMPSSSELKKLGKILASFLEAALVALSISYLSSFDTIVGPIGSWECFKAVCSNGGAGASVAALLVLLFFLTTNTNLKRIRISTVAVSGIIVLAAILSNAVNQANTVNVLFESKTKLILTLVTVSALWVFLTSLIDCVFRALSVRSCEWHNGSFSLGPKHLLITFVVIVVAWAPYYAVFFPGSDCPDIASQIMQFAGTAQWSTHHPLFSSLIYGALFSLGNVLGGAGGVSLS